MAGIPSTIEAWIAHYPAEWSRYKEPLVTRIKRSCKALQSAILPLLDKLLRSVTALAG
ncbi:MAG: hypothetical protein U0X92_09970 [Anaerolineales bacterium]